MTTESTINITAEPSSTDPALCLFHLEEMIAEARVSARGPEDAAGSPLLEELFKLVGVAQVLVDKNTLLVQKQDCVGWQDLAPQIGAIVRKHLAAGEKLFPAGVPTVDFRQKIKTLLNKEINPALAAHRGRVDLVDVKGKDVYVKFSGGCQGCAAAQMTLKAGVESLLRKNISDLGRIVDATDHAAGEKPYFKSEAPAQSPFKK